MKKDFLIILLVFLTLGAGYLGLRTRERNLWENESFGKGALWPGAGEVEEFSLKRGGGVLRFSKEEGRWGVIGEDGQRIPADEERVESFLESLDTPKTAEVVSENVEGEEFGLREGERGVIVDSQGKEQVWIGKFGPDWQSVFLAWPGKDEVWLWPQIWEIETQAEVWQLEWISNLSQYQIEKVEIKKGEESRIWEKKQEEEWGEEGKEAEKIVESFANLKAGEFLGERGEEKTEYELVLTVNGEEERLLAGQKEGRFWISDDDRYLWELNREDWQKLKAIF